MESGLPKLRSDLIVSKQESAAGTFFVLKDPVTGRSFRFRAPEHFITRQLDGATPLETVRQRVSDRFGESVSSQQIADFLKALERSGLLQANGAGRGRPNSGLPKFRSDV